MVRLRMSENRVWNKSETWRVILVLAVPVIVFLVSVGNGYVGLDDSLILNNPAITSISPANILDIIVPDPGNFGSYQPLRTIAHALVYSISGTSPAGYIILNLILYSLNCLLVYLLALRLTGSFLPDGLTGRSRYIALVTALLFAVHPLHVEVVSWLQGGKQSLMAVFFLLSTIFYHDFLIRGKWWRYVASLAGCVLALASQPGAVALPFVWVVLDIFVAKGSRRGIRQSVVRLLPVIAPAAILAVRVIMSPAAGDSELGFLSWIFYLPWLWVQYLVKLFLAVNLNGRYPYNALHAISPLKLMYWPVLCAAFWFLYRSVGRNRLAVFALIWFAVCLLPTSGFVATGTLMADRYVYLSSIGFSLWLALAIYRLEQSDRKKLIRLALMILLISFAAISVRRQFDWRNKHTFWSRVLNVYPRHSQAMFNIAEEYQMNGDFERARELYSQAVSVSPGYMKAYNNLGICLRNLGDEKSALEMFTKAQKLAPTRSEVWVNVGISQARTGEVDKALESFDYAISLGGKARRTVYYNKSRLLFALGRDNEALKSLDRAVKEYARWIPSEGWQWIGRTLLERGRIALALSYMDYGVELPGFDSECWETFGQLQMYAGRYKQALSSFEYSLLQNSKNNEALILAGWSAQNSGEADKALKYYRAALRKMPEQKAEILNNIGQVLMTQKKYREAEESFRQSLDTKPDFHEAAINLSILYHDTERGEDATIMLKEIIASLEKDPAKSALLEQVKKLQDQWRKRPN